MIHRQKLLVCFIAVIGIISGLFIFEMIHASGIQPIQAEEQDKNPPRQEPLVLEVTLQKQFIDGNVEESTHEEKVWAMEDFWSYYKGWQVVDQQEGKIVLKKEINDISPYMKKNGYFGLANDQLAIFEGLPIHEQVIQSFYQIDTGELESYQRQQLQDGIKIDSKQVYQYVLEAYRGMTPQRSANS
ncbi:BofC C-terminal domain-containing protein [Virgibacillus senegalensis]|uniref:BofC C-terminal domain-containing protein n=1 Tax=Virgibacillus senegalensis TaxID=1499679 RepID=UPI00069CC6C2|nr:BofC C-terminal domain-containing protein [Virgibacillus senegalensis]